MYWPISAKMKTSIQFPKRAHLRSNWPEIFTGCHRRMKVFETWRFLKRVVLRPFPKDLLMTSSNMSRNASGIKNGEGGHEWVRSISCWKHELEGNSWWLYDSTVGAMRIVAYSVPWCKRADKSIFKMFFYDFLK